MKFILTFFMILIPLVAIAPPEEILYLIAPDPVNPFDKIWDATCVVESNGDSTAYRIEWNGKASVGIAQIGQEMLNAFNRATNNCYTLNMMFRPIYARRVFMWHCSKIGPYNDERICREWNGVPTPRPVIRLSLCERDAVLPKT